MDRSIVFDNAEQLFRRLTNRPCNCRTGCDGRAGIYSCKLEVVRRWIVDVERSQRQSATVSESQAGEAP